MPVYGGSGGASLTVANTWTGQQSFTVSPVLHTHGIVSSGAGNGSTTGNSRGTGANDFNTNRTNAAQVASGNYSFLASYRGTAAGLYTATFNRENDSTGDGSTSFGYQCQNAATAIYGLTHGIGGYNETTGAYVQGGTNSGGVGTPNGQYVRATYFGSTTVVGPSNLAVNSGNFAVVPDDVLRLPYADTSALFEIYVVGRKTGNVGAAWILRGAVARPSSGTSVIKGTTDKIVIYQDAGASTWDVGVATDTSHRIAVQVTGESAVTIKWMAVIKLTWVRYF